MGIVKNRHRGLSNFSRVQRDHSTITLGNLVQEEALLLGKDSGDDEYDDFFELSEVDCEYVMVGDQICNVPYRLYDLSDLMEVLSLKTWNSCLTEDERFKLASYLPDMDKQTFSITMIELLNGANVFFGNPLGTFFHRLKGGFYSPQVTRYRESLQFLQRRQYYHYLRSYHESIIHKFVGMKKAWNGLQPNISIEDRVHIWNNRIDHKPVFLVDLNAVPSDEQTVNKGDKTLTTISLSKKKRMTNVGINAHVSANVSNDVTVKTKVKGKGVLKIKPVEMNLNQNHVAQQFPSKSLEPFWRQQKGVLKIKPKNAPIAQARHSAIQISPEPPLVDLAGVQTSRFFPPQFASKWHEDAFTSHLPLQHHTITDGKADTCHGLPELTKSQESLHVVAGLVNNSQNSQVKMSLVNDMRLNNASELCEEIFPLKNNQNSRKQSHKVGGAGEYCSEHLRLSSCLDSRIHCGSSTDSYPSAPENNLGGRRMTPVHMTVSEAISRISTIRTGVPQRFPKSSDHLEHRHDLSDVGRKALPLHMDVSGVQREGPAVFPMAYKRKKPYQNPNTWNSLTQPPVVAELEPVHQLNGNQKSVRIKFKDMNDYNAQIN